MPPNALSSRRQAGVPSQIGALLPMTGEVFRSRGTRVVVARAIRGGLRRVHGLGALCRAREAGLTAGPSLPTET